MPKMNILLCGGGTGGHYYPLMAIKEDLHSKSDFRFSFIGAKKGIESSKIHSESIAFKLISISGLSRKVSIKSLFQNIIVGINIIIGFFHVLIFFINKNLIWLFPLEDIHPFCHCKWQECLKFLTCYMNKILIQEL